MIAETVKRSCENKAAVVAMDEKEDGVRATLNLGHTFGHAIETGLGYGAWLHGEAVATGTHAHYLTHSLTNSIIYSLTHSLILIPHIPRYDDGCGVQLQVRIDRGGFSG